MLKRSKQGSETSETSSSSASDSNTFYEDDFSSPEDSSEEEGKLLYFRKYQIHVYVCRRRQIFFSISCVLRNRF